MSLKVENRIPEMIGVLTRVNSPQNRREALRGPARTGLEYVSRILRRNAPEGQDEPSFAGARGIVDHGRPSIRQHGETLEMGWRNPRIENFGPGLSFVIENWAPHVLHVIYGTRGHFIFAPTHETLTFYWDDYSSDMEGGWGPYQGGYPGKYSFTRVNHPGARKNDFVQISTREARPRMIELTKEGAAIAMRPLNQFFGRS